MESTPVSRKAPQQRVADDETSPELTTGLTPSCLMEVERGYNRMLVRIVPQRDFVKRFMTNYLPLRISSGYGASVDDTLNAIREAACGVKDQIQEELLELETRLLDLPYVLGKEDAAELSLIHLLCATLTASSDRPSMMAGQGNPAITDSENATQTNANLETSTTGIAHTPSEMHNVQATQPHRVFHRGRKSLGDRVKAAKCVEVLRRSERIARRRSECIAQRRSKFTARKQQARLLD